MWLVSTGSLHSFMQVEYQSWDEVTLKFYVAGPIHGQPERNKPAFDTAKSLLRSLHHEVVIPHEIPPAEHEGLPCPDTYRGEDYEHDSACYLKTDLIVMLQDCDGIFLLKGWEVSRGARLEYQIARMTGMKLAFEEGALRYLPLPGIDDILPI